MRIHFAVTALVFAGISATADAADKVRAAIGQRGLWDTSVVAQGVEQGFFKKENLDIEITWTRGGAETLQAVITGRVTSIVLCQQEGGAEAL